MTWSAYLQIEGISSAELRATNSDQTDSALEEPIVWWLAALLVQKFLAQTSWSSWPVLTILLLLLLLLLLLILVSAHRDKSNTWFFNLLKTTSTTGSDPSFLMLELTSHLLLESLMPLHEILVRNSLINIQNRKVRLWKLLTSSLSTYNKGVQLLLW